MVKAITEAADHFGSQGALARQLGVTPMAVSNWKRRRVPVERAVQIERLTGGVVPKERLRPDVFGQLEDEISASYSVKEE